MKETKVLKEIGSKRTGDTREYLMSDGSRRVIMRLATDKRAATVRDGVEIENYQIDNYIDKLNAYPDPLSEYNIVYYEYGIIGLAIRAKLAAFDGDISGIRLRYAVKSGEPRNVGLMLFEMNSLEDTITQNGVYRCYADCETSDGKSYVSADIYPWIKDSPNEDHYFGIYFSGNSRTDPISLYGTSSANPPEIIIDYIPSVGVDYKQSYIESSAGNAGVFKFNANTGRALFGKTLFALGGERMPMSLGMTYNPHLKGSRVKSVLPQGWKFDCEQFVYTSDGKYYYVDGNYECHTFLPLTGNKYYDTAHTGLILTVTSSTVKLTDGHTNELIFSEGRLTEIREKVGKNGSSSVYNETVLKYSGGKLSGITDGMGRTATVSGTGVVTVTKPDGNIITLAPTQNGLTVTDGDENYVYTYVETAGTKQLASIKTIISSSETRRLDIGYTDGAKVSTVKEIINGNAVKRYGIEYGYLYTDVSVADYPRSDSRVTKTLRYSFAENGEALTAFEIKDDKAAAVRLKSEEDFKKYVINLSSESAEGIDYRGNTINTSEGTDELVFGFDDVTVSDENDSDGYAVSAQIAVDTANSREGGFDMDIVVGTDLGSGIFHEYDKKTVHIDNYEGIQMIYFDVGRWISDPSTWRGCMFRVPSDVKAKLEITNVRLGVEPDSTETYCVNVPTGGRSFTEYGVSALCGAAVCGAAVTGGTVWHELTDCAVKRGSSVVLDSVRMTKNDWLLTLESYARNSGDYVVWHDDLSGAVRMVSDATFVFGQTSAGINNIRFATVTKNRSRKVFEYNSYGKGDEYIVTTKNTVFADDTSKICREYYDESLNCVKTVDSEGTVTETEYAYGNPVRVSTHNGEYNLVTEKVYGTANGLNNGTGYYLIKETETVLGADHSHTYGYTNATGDMTQSTTPKGQRTDYAYLSDGNVTKISATVDSTENKNEFEYEKGRLKSIKHNGFAYDFEYNAYDEVTGVKIGNKYCLSKGYTHSYTGSSTTFDHDAESLTNRNYDVYGRLTGVYNLNIGERDEEYRTDIYGGVSDDVSSVTSPTDSRLTINAESKLRKRIDNGQTMLYNYDKRGNLKKVERNQGAMFLMKSEFEYDRDDRITQRKYTSGIGIVQTQKTAYKDGDALNADKQQKTETTIGGRTISTEDGYDALGRTSTVTRKVGSIQLKDTYEYFTRNGNETDSTNYVSRVVKSLPDTTLIESYMYDGNGNISKIITPNGHVDYRYDGLNRLVREDNGVLGKTYIYAYDGGGNITGRTEYAYTTVTNPANGNVIGFAYTDNVYKDKLTSYNGQTCTYDDAGNLTGYKGAELTWKYGRLESYNKDSHTTYYKYDGEDVRRRKITGSRQTTYYYEGSKLLGELREELDTTTPICYIYDHRGIAGYYDGYGVYVYRKNLQGDVTGIYNESGTLVAEYAYDAYGRCKILKDVDGKATENAIRYRGYYYDNESGLYYLINRYYDPELGRFISRDHIGYMAEQTESINGCNLYVYCLNNPVMGVDPEGTFFWFILVGAIIGAVVNTATYTVSTAIESAISGENKFTVGGFIGAAVGGAIGGAVSAIPISNTLATGISGAISNALTMGLENAFGEANHSIEDIISSSIFSGIFGAATSVIGSKIKIKGLNAGRGSFQQVKRQLTTKAFKGQIKRISVKSFAKMFAYELYGGASSAIGTTVAGILKNIMA